MCHQEQKKPLRNQGFFYVETSCSPSEEQIKNTHQRCIAGGKKGEELLVIRLPGYAGFLPEKLYRNNQT